MNIVAELWAHAEKCSHNPTSLPGGDFIPMRNAIDFGYAMVYPDRLIFCFRGTDGQLAAWARNFDPYPMQEGATIHEGFWDAFNAFKKPVGEIVAAYPDLPIYCTGHSRGGAIATLCARHIARAIKIPCSLVSFGAPSQGSKHYRDQVDGLPINHTRVVNGRDIVPTLPPRALGFRHAGKLLHLPSPRWTALIPGQRVRDHYYSRYTKALIKWSAAKNDYSAVAMLRQTLTQCEV